MEIVIKILLLLLLPGSLMAQETKRTGIDPAVIKVSDQSANMNDTLYLMYYTDILYNVPSQNGNYKELLATMDKDSLFRFKFPVDKESGSFFIGRKTQKADSIYKVSSSLRFLLLSDVYLPEAGDDILLQVKEYKRKIGGHQVKVSFKGRGSAKYIIKDSLKMVGAGIKGTGVFNERFEYVSANSDEKILDAKLCYLEAHKNLLNDEVYNVLKADILYSTPVINAGLIEYYYKKKSVNANPELTKLAQEKFRQEYNIYFRENPDYGIPIKALLKSRYYIPYLLQKTARCDFLVNNIDKDSLYNYLKINYAGELRDQLLTTYFLSKDLVGFIDSDHLTDAISTVKSNYCLQKLKDLDKGFATGTIHDFLLSDRNGKTIKISGYKNKVILIDFWFTGCGACRDYFKQELSDIERHFKNNSNIVFISISIDRDRSSWQKSVQSMQYTSENAVNLYTSGLGSQHDIIKFFNISGYPAILLIGKDGKILENNSSKLYEFSTAVELIENNIKKDVLKIN